MIRLLITIVLTILLCLHGLDLIAQKIKVVTTSIEDIDNKLVIKYDFVKSKENQQFSVSLQITGSSGNMIPSKSLTGNVGDSIEGGTNKQIIWDYIADGIVLKDDINIEVIAYLLPEIGSTSNVSMTKALFLSTICPGLGLSKIKKRPYWLMGIVGFGCLGTSYYLNKQANKNYTSYIENNVDELNDGLLSKSQNQNQLSKTFAYTAIGVWGINLVWTAIKAKRNYQKTTSLINKQQFFFYSGVDPFTKTAGFSFKYRF
jgi:hypothetical protein